MTDTKNAAPSDAEIDEVLCKHWPAYSMQAVLRKMWLREAIKSAIAKWGTPQPVVREPLTANQVSELANSAGYWHGDTSRADFINGIRYAEAAHGIKGGQHGAK